MDRLTAILIAVVCFVGCGCRDCGRSTRPAVAAIDAETSVAAAARSSERSCSPTRFRQTRLLRDLLCWARLAPVRSGVHLQRAAGLRSPDLGTYDGGLWMALTTLTAGAFVAAALRRRAADHA